MTPPANRDGDAYEAGLRAGYAHGYDVGLAHGRARAQGNLDLDLDAHDPPPARLAGPDRAERIARGYIPRDHTRPPALPVRLWDAADWAKADERDLPTTEHGRAQWQAILDAGRVPPHLAAAYEGRSPDDPMSDAATDLAEQLTHEVADTARVLADLRARLHPPGPAGGRRCHADEAPWRGNGANPVEAPQCERGVGR